MIFIVRIILCVFFIFCVIKVVWGTSEEIGKIIWKSFHQKQPGACTVQNELFSVHYVQSRINYPTTTFVLHSISQLYIVLETSSPQLCRVAGVSLAMLSSSS